MNKQELLQIIHEKREQYLQADTPELQSKRQKFLDWLYCQGDDTPYVLEMYPQNIYGKRTIPQYLHEFPFANTRTQLKTELRAETDKLSPERAQSFMAEISLELLKKEIHFCVFYAEGQRSPHIIIYDFQELAELTPFQRMKARAKFWRWVIPFRMHILDASLWDDSHYVPLEFAPHWKYGSPFDLLFEYLPKQKIHEKIKNNNEKKIKLISNFKQSSASKYYKNCSNCEGHSYLTVGNFYLCTICGNKEDFKNAKITP